MKSKQVRMKSKPIGFDEIKSVLYSDNVGFHHEVISFAKQIYSVCKTDLAEKSTSNEVLFSGCRTRIRTQTNRVRVCCATFTQFGIIYDSQLLPQVVLVRETGLEPVWCYHTHLKRARLPIPPLSHIGAE